MLRRVIFVCLFALILVGCASPAAPAPTATPVPTLIPESPTAVPTATPIPPTAEPQADISEAEPTATPIPTAVPMRTFVMIPEESKALYRVEEEFFQGAVDRLGQVLGFNTAVGWTRTMEGELQLVTNGESVTIEGGHFTIDLRTLKSDERLRDERIQQQYLESNQFPWAEFEITGVEGFPESYAEGEEITFELIGDLTIREITNEVRLETTAVLEGNTITATAFTDIMMVDFGFDPPIILGFLEALDPARIEIELTAVEGE